MFDSARKDLPRTTFFFNCKYFYLVELFSASTPGMIFSRVGCSSYVFKFFPGRVRVCNLIPRSKTQGPSFILQGSRAFSAGSDKVRDLSLELVESEDYAFAREILRIPGSKQRLFLIQPRIKWGPRRNHLTTPALQMEENMTLVETLDWQVVDSIILPVDSYDSAHVFGKGNFEKLQDLIKGSTKSISGIFFGANILKSSQMKTYQDAFHMPIYDRYRIVLEIFRSHAKTKEAKLQVALAELPYLRSVLHGSQDESTSIQPHSASSSGQTWTGLRRQIIRVEYFFSRK
jgi:hypothetical protein